MSNNQINWRSEMIRHQVALKAVAVILASVLILLLGLLPLLRSAGTNLKKIESRSSEAEALSSKVAVLSQIDQRVLKERAATIKTALPENKDVIAYLSAVDGLSKELGLSFGGIVLSPGVVSGEQKQASSKAKNSRTISKLDVLDTTIKITGSRDGIYSFLRQVEQTLPLMQITDVSVSLVEDDLYSMTLSLGMLWAASPANDLKGAIKLFTEKEEAYFAKLGNFRSYKINEQLLESSVEPRQDLFEQN